MPTFQEILEQRRSGRQKADLSTEEGLRQLAESRGFEIEKKEDKLSFLQRLGRGLSAFEPANAIFESRYEDKNFAVEYVKDVFQEVGTAITGREMQDEGEIKKTWKDILVKEGMKDREGRPDPVDFAGFFLDVLTDPTTLFGGQMVKGATRVSKGISGKVLSSAKRRAPEATERLLAKGEQVKDVLGELFTPAYKVSEDGADRLARIRNVESRIRGVNQVRVAKDLDGIQKLSKDAYDDLHNALFRTGKGYGITRQHWMDKEGVKIAAEKLAKLKAKRANLRKFKRMKKLDRATRTSVERMEKEIAKGQGELTQILSQYLSDEAITKLTSTAMRPVGTIPRSMLREAYQAKQFETFEDFAKSPIAEKLQRKAITGEFAAHGIDSVEEFYEIAVKGGIVPSKTTQRVVDPLGKVDELQSELDEMVEAARKSLPEDLAKNLDVHDLAKVEIPHAVTEKALAKKEGQVEILTRMQLYGKLRKTKGSLEKQALQREHTLILRNIRDKQRQIYKTERSILGKAESKMALKQREIFKTQEKLFNVKDIDLETTEDAVRAMKLLDETYKIDIQGLQKQFDELGKTATRKFIPIFEKAVHKNFTNPEAAKFFREKGLKAISKHQDIFAQQTGIARQDILTPFLPARLKKTGAAAYSTLRVSGQGYLKRTKGILEKADLEDDIAKIYADSASTAMIDNFRGKELRRWVDELGRPLDTFENARDAERAGFRLLKEKGQFGKELGWVTKWDHKALTEIQDPGFKLINDLAKVSGYDWLTAKFKRMVTGLPFVSFFTRNIVSGQVQNFEVMGLQAFDPRILAASEDLTRKMLGDKMGKEVIEWAGEKWKPQALIKPFMDRFGISSSYISDYGIGKVDSLVKAGRWFEWNRAIGNHIEIQQKMTVYLGMLKKGYGKKQALDFAELAGFDYSRLAPFEKHVMRRLIPFYTFTRKNMELQLKTLAKHPDRLAALTKAGRSVGSPQGVTYEQDGEELVIPDWMRDRFVARFGESQYGLPQVFSGFGLPIEETAELLDNGIMGILARMNPMLKLPMEIGLDKNFFYRRDLKEVYSAKEYGQAPQMLKDFLKIQESKKKPVYKDGKKTGEFKVTYVADPIRLEIVRSLFTSRGISYLHTMFGEHELDVKGRMMKALTGFRPYEVDEATTIFFEDRENYRDSIDLLNALGVTGTLERAYEKEPIK